MGKTFINILTILVDRILHDSYGNPIARKVYPAFYECKYFFYNHISNITR